MDIYEFTQALWRQRRWLIGGFVVLILGIFFLVFKVSGDGIEQRVTPKYVAQARMAVVEAEFDSLTEANAGGNFSSVAGLYAELLRSPQASLEIQQEEGVVFVEPMEVGVPSRTSFINVTVTSDTPQNASRGALGAFRWLSDRLQQPPTLADIPVDILETADILDDEGKFLGQIRLSVDRQFLAEDLFLVITNGLGDETAVPLEDVTGVSLHQAFLVPGSSMTLSIEDVTGFVYDRTMLYLPALPEEQLRDVPSLVLTVDAGAIRVAELPESSDAAGSAGDEAAVDSDPTLNPERISTFWDTGSPVEQSRQLTLMLITEEPIPTLTGQRRTPIIALAGFGVSILVLLVAAVTVDTWQQAWAERRDQQETPDSSADEDPEEAQVAPQFVTRSRATADEVEEREGLPGETVWADDTELRRKRA